MGLGEGHGGHVLESKTSNACLFQLSREPTPDVVVHKAALY